MALESSRYCLVAGDGKSTTMFDNEGANEGVKVQG